MLHTIWAGSVKPRYELLAREADSGLARFVTCTVPHRIAAHLHDDLPKAAPLLG